MNQEVLFIDCKLCLISISQTSFTVSSLILAFNHCLFKPLPLFTKQTAAATIYRNDHYKRSWSQIKCLHICEYSKPVDTFDLTVAIIPGVCSYQPIVISIFFKRQTTLPPSVASVSTRTSNLEGKIHGANMGPFWGPQEPGGPHVGPMNFAIWGYTWTRGLK